MTDITKWGDQPTHASVETTRKELTKKAALIKTRYDALPLGTRFGYAAAIMLTAEYKGKVDKSKPLELEDTWTFKPPEQPESYDSAIDGKTALVKVEKWKRRGKRDDKIMRSTSAVKMQ